MASMTPRTAPARRRQVAAGHPQRPRWTSSRSTASPAPAWTASPSAADVNKRLIYYYFSSKDDLFLAVLERTYAEHPRGREAAAPARAGAGRGDPPPDLLHLALLHRASRVHDPAQQRKPAPGPRTCKRSRAHPGNELAAGRDAGRGPRARPQATELFRGGIDPVQLYVSIASLCYFYLSNNYTLSAIFGRDLRTPKAHGAAPLAHERSGSGLRPALIRVSP